MQDLERILVQLRRLNELEVQPLAPWAAMLEPRERALEIERARQGLPTSLLGHHDRMVAKGMRSLVGIKGGCCEACGAKMPEYQESAKVSDRVRILEVCDRCGVFLEYPSETASAITGRMRTHQRKKISQHDVIREAGLR